MLNFDLDKKQLELQQKARKFALERVLPASWHYDDKDEIPLFILKEAFDQGLMNTDIPSKYGGKGFGLVEGALITEEIAAACPGIATSIFDNSLGMEPLMLCDNERAKEKYFKLMLSDFKRMCFATSEPVMGSDVSSMICKGEKTEGGYLINGTKYWVTNGGVADYMTIFATIDPKSKHEGIACFLIEKEWDGVRVGKHIPKMGQRCSNTVGLNFKNVFVPDENVLAEPGKGFVLAMQTFARTRPMIGAFAVGAARSAMDYAIHYAKKRRAFGMKLAAFQAIQFKIAEMMQKVDTSRLMVIRSAWIADQDRDPTFTASMAKFYSTESAMEVVQDAIQVMGGYGYTRLYPLEKLMRDIRLYSIYEGTSEIQRMIVAGHALGAYEPIMPSLDDIPMIRDIDLGDESQANQSAWRCRICGHMHYGDEAPEECPYCFFPESAFNKVWPL
ncbi:MAG: acyl-CoA dehydrogenase family protein [Bacteroidales bacterium]|jgi:acyl-CoA dehydrogenase|nr:acyl-CoA dehydrogenase family protein [Bacteroidales bacterium]